MDHYRSSTRRSFPMRWLSMKTALVLFAFLALLPPAALTAARAPRWQALPQHGDVPPPLYEAGISFSRAGDEADTVW
jgi:hypothetical protein